MRIFFSVGEPSGDLHASNLISDIKTRCPDVECVGFGGPKMQSQGCEILFQLTELAVMFLWDAVKNLRKFFALIAQAERFFERKHVDAVVLIDYPGFNWWIARKAKKHGIPVFYYGVPQVWAWAPWRITKIRRFVDAVLCKLPFETDWFRARNINAMYVGHPYFDQLQRQTYDQEFIATHDNERHKVLLLPGSRDSEVKKNTETLVRSAGLINERLASQVDFFVGCYHEKHLPEVNRKLAKSTAAIKVFAGRTPELMKMADVCIACSGSVSLELLHYRIPTVIVFKISRVQMLLQAVLRNCKYITLVNLIDCADIRKRSWQNYDPDSAGAEPVPMPEYLTCGDCTKQVSNRIISWLENAEQRRANVKILDRIALQYAIAGSTERTAELILSHIGSNASNESIANHQNHAA